MPQLPPTPDSRWPRAMATVTACRYEFGAGQALAFGLPLSRHFRISYNYFVDGTLHTGEFQAAKPMPQGTLFSLAYNPDAPQRNERSAAGSPMRSPVLVVGIIGSVVLSLGWLLVLRSCA